MRLHAMQTLELGLALLATLGMSPLPSAAQTDSSATSWSFENVWFRSEKRPSLIKAFAASGQLTVDSKGLTFHADKVDVSIPIMGIRDVSVGRMKGDGYNDWAIVTYDEDGTSRIVGFKDGKGLDFGRNTTSEIRDAIAWLLGPEHCLEPSAKDALIILGRNFVEPVVKRGFPGSPARLLSDSKTTGMLILDGDVDGEDLTGAALIREGDQPCITRSGTVHLKGADGVILFTGLPPGRHVVRIVAGLVVREAVDNSLEMNEYLRGLREPRDFRLNAQDLAVTIEAGDVHYLGRVHFKTWPGDLAVPVIERDPVREQRVRELLLDRYPGTRWAWLARE